MRSQAAGRWALIALALGALAGCRTPLEVRLASADEALPSPSFTVASTAGPKEPPRYDTFEVLEESGAVMWRARALQFGSAPRPRAITYGVAPEGFETQEGPLALEEGHTYALFLFYTDPPDGRLHFQVEAGGAVRERPR